MNRRGPSRSWGRKRNDNKSRSQQREQQSFHRRNFRIVAAPLLFIFSLLRTVALQLWIVLGILVCRGSAIAGRSGTRSSRQSERDAEAGTPMNQKSRNTPGPGEPILATQKHHHRKAFEYISKALKIDEEDAGRKDIAIELYRKGITELQKGIALEIRGQGDPWDRAKRLQEKMMTNLAMAQERLEVLEKLLRETHIGSEAEATCNSNPREEAGPSIAPNLRERKPHVSTNVTVRRPQSASKYSTPPTVIPKPSVIPKSTAHLSTTCSRGAIVIGHRPASVRATELKQRAILAVY